MQLLTAARQATLCWQCCRKLPDNNSRFDTPALESSSRGGVLLLCLCRSELCAGEEALECPMFGLGCVAL